VIWEEDDVSSQSLTSAVSESKEEESQSDRKHLPNLKLSIHPGFSQRLSTALVTFNDLT